MEKVNNKHQKMGNGSREVKILRNNQRDILEIKNTITEMKSAFDGLIYRLDTTEKRHVEFEDLSLET